MSIWEKLGFGGYKGFSHESDQLLRSAVELAGNLGCEKADTGHLLLAILQQDHGAAARFLEGKQIREPEVRRQLAESRRAPALHLDRYALAPDLKRTMDYAIIGAQNAHLNRAEPEHLLCAMLEDTAAQQASCWHPWACSSQMPCGSVASCPGSSYCRIRRGPRSVRRAAAAPVISTAGI